MCTNFFRGDPYYSLHISEEGGQPWRMCKIPFHAIFCVYCAEGLVENGNQRVFKNLLAFFAGILYIDLKVKSSQRPNIGMWAPHTHCGVSNQRQETEMLALCAQILIWVGKKAPEHLV